MGLGAYFAKCCPVTIRRTCRATSVRVIISLPISGVALSEWLLEVLAAAKPASLGSQIKHVCVDKNRGVLALTSTLRFLVVSNSSYLEADSICIVADKNRTTIKENIA